MSELNVSPAALVDEQRFVACLERLGVDVVSIGPQRFVATVQSVQVGLYCYDAPYAVCVHLVFDDCLVPALRYGAAVEWVNAANLDMAFVSAFVAPVPADSTRDGGSDGESMSVQQHDECEDLGLAQGDSGRGGEYVVAAYASMLTAGGVTDEQLDASVATAIEAMVEFSARFEVFYRERIAPHE